MLKIEPLALSDAALQHLEDLHKEISGELGFAARKEKAGELWAARGNTIDGKAVFTEVKTALKQIAVGYGTCNYCEMSIACDVEHIWPKAYFPLRTFRWANFLYACTPCNRHAKGDKVWIFDEGSDTPRKLRKAEAPPNEDYCFIDPRVENPSDYLELEIDKNSPLFMHFLPSLATGPSGKRFQKAEKTLEILKLNKNEDLVNYRKGAFGQYKRLLKEYVAAKEAADHQTLEDAVVGDPRVDFTLPLETERERIMEATRTTILTSLYPSVWYAMRTQTHLLPVQMQDLFVRAGVAAWPAR